MAVVKPLYKNGDKFEISMYRPFHCYQSFSRFLIQPLFVPGVNDFSKKLGGGAPNILF